MRPLSTDLANYALISRTRELLAEKEKEQKEEKERWTHIESVLNKHIGNCLSKLEQKDEEISELNDLITKKDEQLKAEKETLAQTASNLNELIAKKNKQLSQTKKKLSQQNAEKDKQLQQENDDNALRSRHRLEQINLSPNFDGSIISRVVLLYFSGGGYHFPWYS